MIMNVCVFVRRGLCVCVCLSVCLSACLPLSCNELSRADGALWLSFTTGTYIYSSLLEAFSTHTI